MSISRIFLATALLLAADVSTGQYRNYSLRCLAPIIDNIDPNAPETLQEAFLAGPQHSAKPLEEIGADAIDFPISTESEEAQKMFEQGIALLHVLWYEEAERAFRTVIELDPDCPMGYWGLAQASERSPQRARIFAEEARNRSDRNRPELEQRWTELLAEFYSEDEKLDFTSRSANRVRALEELVIDFPDHREVRAFLIRRLTLDQFVAGLPVTSTLGVDSLAQEFAEEASTHPSRHYRVFLWLNRRPERVLEDAVKMTELTPGAAEIWRYAAEAHLSAGRSAEAAIYAEAALRIDHEDLAKRNLMPWEAQNIRDNYSALVNLLTHSGQIEEAVDWAKRALLLPRKLSNSEIAAEELWVNARMNAGQWQKLLEELDTHRLLRASELPKDRAYRLSSEGIAHLALGNAELAQDKADALVDLEREALIQGISSADENAIAKSRQRLKEVQKIFTAAQSGATDSLSGTELPIIAKARLLEQFGTAGEAFGLMQTLRESQPYQWLPTAYFCRLARETGREREALFSIDRRFRSDSSRADRGLDVFDDLNQLAQRLKLPGDWKIAASAPKTSFRVDPLGPSTWQAPSAPSFELPDRLGQLHSLEEFSGKPVLLNFFLGVQCAFCLDQFDTFKPYYPSFSEAGIEVIAISIDSQETLRRILGENDEPDAAYAERFPFPILADPKVEVFKKYGVFDDFENGPMHATVMIGPAGRILWRNIAHTPFQDPSALLQEAKRLLTVHEPAKSPDSSD